MKCAKFFVNPRECSFTLMMRGSDSSSKRIDSHRDSCPADKIVWLGRASGAKSAVFIDLMSDSDDSLSLSGRTF